MLKMDGADLPCEALDTMCGRRARVCRGMLSVATAGGARGADLGSSSIFINMWRWVRPRKEVTRRLLKGNRVEIHGAMRWVVTRLATAAARRRQFSGGRMSGA